MSVEAMTWAFTVPLPPCPKSILVALANRADEDGRCWPGVADLERRTGWSRRAVQQGVRYLMQVDLLCLEERYRASGRQESNLYCLRIGSTPRAVEGAAGARGRVQQVHGEGAAGARGRVQQVHGEGAAGARGRVQQVHGEGAAGAPESSSESSVEQSSEHTSRADAVERVRVGCPYSEEFEEFWEQFPRKVGKKAAWIAWQKARDKPAIDVLLQVIDLVRQSDQWLRGIIPNPATWLNQGRWFDQVTVVKPVVVGPKAFQPIPNLPERGDACPEEASAVLSRLLGRKAFSFPADQQGAA